MNQAPANRADEKLFSLHWEIKTVLYLGVMTLSTGLGILIYKNIDTLGHQVILAIIAAISGGCFFYCFKTKKPFSFLRVKPPNSFFDYVLLLACLSFLTFVGYLQFQYQVFGLNYGMATCIPMLVLFYVAYNFDHLGILSLAVTNLGVWMGLSLTPTRLLLTNDYNSEVLIYMYLLLGLILLLAADLTERYQVKPHFEFTYQHFGTHVGFISLLAGYFFYLDHFYGLMFMVVLAALGAYIYKKAIQQRSFYFLLLVVLYGYIALSSLIVTALVRINDGGLFLMLFYFTFSAFGFVSLLIRLNKKIKDS